jgi:hypothetical protein
MVALSSPPVDISSAIKRDHKGRALAPSFLEEVDDDDLEDQVGLLLVNLLSP